MFNKLDLNQKKNVVTIGKLTEEIIELLEIEITEEKNIVIWKDRIKYIEKHKSDFDSDEEWKTHVEAIPDIIENPDYVSIHPSGRSIEFIKKINEHMLVAVRLTNKKTLDFRSSYPISENKLQSYLDSGRLKLVSKLPINE